MLPCSQESVVVMRRGKRGDAGILPRDATRTLDGDGRAARVLEFFYSAGLFPVHEYWYVLTQY